MQILSLALTIGIIPWILGIPWARMMESKCISIAAYGIGFFIELAMFHVVAFIGTISYTPFHVISTEFSVVLMILTVFCICYSYHNRLFPKRNRRKKQRKLSGYEWILLLTFLVSFSIQIIRGFTYDLTYMSYDDATYVAYAADALELGYVGSIDAYTGVGGALSVQRAIQTSLVFPSFLSKISGVSVATIEHTVLHIQLIVLAYCIYFYMADELFNKREYKLLFISMISVFYIFGYHSHYSLTFRLLGPNYQGKAILAVSLTPLIFIFLVKKLSGPYEWKSGLLLMILSLSAVSLTLWGVGTLLVIISIPIILSLFRKERQWRHLLYVLWGMVIPLGFAGYNLLYRYAI